MTDTIFANARIVLPTEVITGSLRIRDGLIDSIDHGAAVPAGAMDCGGDRIAAGLVELHTDNLERHIEPRPGVHWPHAAAILAHDAELAGVGITTVFDAMRVGSIPSQKNGEYRKYARGLSQELGALRETGSLRISHLLHLRAEVCSETLEAELAEFGPQDGVGLVSLMDHTPGQRQFRDVTKLAAYVRGKHSLTEAQFEDHIAHLKGLRDTYGDLHERVAVAEARRFGAVIASHDDTTEAQVAASAAHGIRLAEFPTTVEAARACHTHGIAVIMGAPNLIRGGSHSGNVAAKELAELGLLDILSSDYVPAALLTGSLALGDLWDDPARGHATVSTNPARSAGLTDRGEIALGMRADLIRIANVGGMRVLRETWVAGRRVA